MTKRRIAAEPRKRWTPAEDAIVREHYPHRCTRDVVALLPGRTYTSVSNRAKTLGVGKSEAFMRSLGSGRLNEGSTRGARHRFTKGHATWNKGHSYTAGGRSALTRFAKGMRPHNAVDVGTRLRDSEGYWKEKVGEPRRWQYCHRAAWEAVHGPVPRGMALLFRDGNKDHYQIENLQLVPRRDLMARNSVHNLPKPLVELVQLRGAVVRKINRLSRATTHAQQD